jgi:hypothetical protein
MSNVTKCIHKISIKYKSNEDILSSLDLKSNLEFLVSISRRTRKKIKEAEIELRMHSTFSDRNRKDLYENDEVYFGNKMRGIVSFEKGCFGIRITEPESEKRFIPFYEMHVSEDMVVNSVEKL